MMIPRYIPRLQAIAVELQDRFDEMRSLSLRINDGRLFFRRDGNSKEDIVIGLGQVRDLMTKIEENNLAIRDLMTEYALLAEANAIDFSATFKIPAHETDMGTAPNKVVTVGSDELAEINAEQLWLMQLSTKLFSSVPRDVEIKERREP